MLHNENDMEEIKRRLAKLPYRSAPPQLIHKLRRIVHQESWRHRFWNWFIQPLIWKPLSAVSAVAVVASLWIYLRPAAEQEFVDMDTLLTAHSRYQGENLIPTADMAQADYSARLASFYDED